MNLDEEWLNFSENIDNNNNININNNTNNINNVNNFNNNNNNSNHTKLIPKCSDIHISTKTKICYLNIPIDLYDIFWKLEINNYHLPIEGIIKKTMKFNCTDHEQVKILDEHIKNETNIEVYQINKVESKNKFKDIRKIIVGISNKDILTNKKKKKSAFYNCFAIIFRVKNKEGAFKEFHIKVFNTGKLEIPGVQDEELLFVTLNKLCNVLKNILDTEIYYSKDNTDNVLINSNFTCNFYINRNKLFNLLRNKYNMHSLYDPCSYPGIQCKFYYNENNKKNDGVCYCEKSCGYTEKSIKKLNKNKCTEISFMIFRTGSTLIVGRCDEHILKIVYNYLKKILINEYENIYIDSNIDISKKKSKYSTNTKLKKKTLLFTENPVYEPII